MVFSTVFILKRKEFLNILAQFPSDQQKFFKIRDNSIFEKNQDKLHYTCSNCEKEGHFEFKCPALIYTDQKDYAEYYVQYYMMAIRLFRKCFKRPQRRRHQTLKKNKDIKFAAFRIQNYHAKEIQTLIENCNYPDFDENIERRIDTSSYRKTYMFPERILKYENPEDVVNDGYLQLEQQLDQHNFVLNKEMMNLKRLLLRKEINDRSNR